jgi:cell division protein FtsB
MELPLILVCNKLAYYIADYISQFKIGQRNIAAQPADAEALTQEQKKTKRIRSHLSGGPAARCPKARAFQQLMIRSLICVKRERARSARMLSIPLHFVQFLSVFCNAL